MIYCEAEGRLPVYNSEHSCKSVSTGLRDCVSEQQACPLWRGVDASFPGPQEANKEPQMLAKPGSASPAQPPVAGEPEHQGPKVPDSTDQGLDPSSGLNLGLIHP